MSKGNVLILGATSGMAEECAVNFSKNGYSLILAGRDKKKLAVLKDRLGSSDVEIAYFDALDKNKHATFVNELPVFPDIVLLAYGYLGDQELAQTNLEEANKIIETNFASVVSILNIISTKMEERSSGTIAAIGSVAGDKGRAKNYIYGSSKAALHEYLSGMRQRLFNKGVKVITIKPGFVKTKMLEGLETPGALTCSAKKAGRQIYKGIVSGRAEFYIDWKWYWVMMVIKHLPNALFIRTKF